MTLRIGPPAEGDDFFDREIERAQMWRALPANHIVLSAPRRLGKTSLLKKLALEAADHGLLAAYLDVSRRESAADLMGALAEALPERSIAAHMQRAGSKALGWLNRIGRIRIELDGMGGMELETQGAGAKSWQESADLLQRRLSPRPLLIILDEFSVFIHRLLQQRPEEARALLTHLRTWRQTGQVACRFVFSGSIGLNRLLERYRLQTETNDCDDYRLGPFAEADAVAMITALATREGWPLDEPTALAMCQRVGWLSPYYLVTVLEEAIRAAMFRLRAVAPCGATLTAGDVDQAFAQLLDTRSKFNHWHLRLNDHFPGATLDWARLLLARLASRANGALVTTVCALPGHPDDAPEHLLLLEEHGYIVRDGKRIQFQSPLLRLYWKKNHGE
jgi:uncharacterized protein